MDKDHILAILREHEAELKAAGLLHLRLFGSVARGEATPSSDIDLLYDLDPSKRINLFDLGRFNYQLTDLLGTQVDLASAGHLKSRIRDRILQEAIVAF